MAHEHGQVVVRFERVSFGYHEDHLLLEEVDFSIRDQAKITIMGQNGAGKSTIFKLLTGALKPTEGRIHIKKGATIALAEQAMPRASLDESIRTFFAHAFPDKRYDLDHKIAQALKTVQLAADPDKRIRDFSGGQQARLLLAYALIQEPDILLLDEPTNNLDQAGIEQLTGFLMLYPKTVLVISHDADFLNAFSDGVLHLDALTRKVETYVGNYFNVVEEIAARLERERRQNARALKEIQDRKDKINFFANKGGKMRKLASKLRDQVETAEDDMVEVRREDKTIRDFLIPAQDLPEPLVRLHTVTLIRNHAPLSVPLDIVLRKKQRLLIAGPNGIGKSSLLRSLAQGTTSGGTLHPDVRLGYYAQDFSELDVEKTAYDALASVMEEPSNELLRSIAAGFLLTADVLKRPIGVLSEGQKGLLCFARFVLQRPGLLILDEPTNHINFRHLPVIARAIDAYEGALIMVSHAPGFVSQIAFDQTLDLSTLT